MGYGMEIAFLELAHVGTYIEWTIQRPHPISAHIE